MAKTIAVPLEIHAGERRVAATPETVVQLLTMQRRWILNSAPPAKVPAGCFQVSLGSSHE
jgi:hypothetical protein